MEVAGSLRSSFGQPESISRAHDDPELFALVNQALAEWIQQSGRKPSIGPTGGCG
jgi:hypothetical protein